MLLLMRKYLTNPENRGTLAGQTDENFGQCMKKSLDKRKRCGKIRRKVNECELWSDGKNPSAADGRPDGKRIKEKTDQLGRFSCSVEVGFHGNDMLDVRKARNTT